MRNCWYRRPERGVNGTLWNGMYGFNKKFSKNIRHSFFFYNKKIESEKNFIKLIKKIENVLKIWKTRNLTVQSQITTFKTFATSKVIHLALVPNVPYVIIDQLNKIQKDFIWNRKHTK